MFRVCNQTTVIRGTMKSLNNSSSHSLKLINLNGYYGQMSRSPQYLHFFTQNHSNALLLFSSFSNTSHKLRLLLLLLFQRSGNVTFKRFCQNGKQKSNITSKPEQPTATMGDYMLFLSFLSIGIASVFVVRDQKKYEKHLMSIAENGVVEEEKEEKLDDHLELENKLKSNVLFPKTSQRICVVYGRKGVGKSTIVRKVIKEMNSDTENPNNGSIIYINACSRPHLMIDSMLTVIGYQRDLNFLKRLTGLYRNSKELIGKNKICIYKLLLLVLFFKKRKNCL